MTTFYGVSEQGIGYIKYLRSTAREIIGSENRLQHRKQCRFCNTHVHSLPTQNLNQLKFWIQCHKMLLESLNVPLNVK